MSEVHLLNLFQQPLLHTGLSHINLLAAGRELWRAFFMPAKAEEGTFGRLAVGQGLCGFFVIFGIVGHGEDAEDVGVGADGSRAVDLAADVVFQFAVAVKQRG